MHNETTDLLLALSAPVATLVAMRFFGISMTTLIMFVLAVAYAVHAQISEHDNGKISNTVLVALIAFVAGGISDTLLNLYSRNSNGVRSLKLREYFTQVGSLRAAVFAALLTFWLVVPTFAIYRYFFSEQPDLILLPIGFVVGFVVGIFSQNSLALRPLLPFYQVTSGWVESRFWDGISVCVALVPVLVYQKVLAK